MYNFRAFSESFDDCARKLKTRINKNVNLFKYTDDPLDNPLLLLPSLAHLQHEFPILLYKTHLFSQDHII